MRLIGCPVTEDIRITSIHQPVDDRRIVRPCPVRRSHQLVAPIEETGRQIPKRIHHMRLQNHCAAANGPGLVQREKRMPKVVEKAEVDYQNKKTEIGRASWRERVWQNVEKWVGVGALKKKKQYG